MMYHDSILSIYSLIICYVAIGHGPVEIVNLPMKDMVIFHSYVNVYRAGYPISSNLPVWNQICFTPVSTVDQNILEPQSQVCYDPATFE